MVKGNKVMMELFLELCVSSTFEKLVWYNEEKWDAGAIWLMQSLRVWKEGIAYAKLFDCYLSFYTWKEIWLKLRVVGLKC